MKTTLKAVFAKVATVALLAGAVVLASPQKAEAQVRVGVGIGFGGPVYRPHYYAPPVVYGPRYGYGYGYGPGFYGPGYYGHFDHYRYGRFHHGYYR